MQFTINIELRSSYEKISHLHIAIPFFSSDIRL